MGDLCYRSFIRSRMARAEENSLGVGEKRGSIVGLETRGRRGVFEVRGVEMLLSRTGWNWYARGEALLD